MEVITTATVEKFCIDCQDLTAALLLLANSKALTPSALAAFDNSAKACKEFLVAYQKYCEKEVL